MAARGSLRRRWFVDKIIKRIRYLVLSLVPWTKADPWEEENIVPIATQNTGTFWHVTLWMMQTLEGLKDSGNPSYSTLNQSTASRAPEEDWQLLLTGGISRDPRNVKKRQKCDSPSSASKMHIKLSTWPHLKPKKARGILRSPNKKDFICSGLSHTVISEENMWTITEQHKIANWGRHKILWEQKGRCVGQHIRYETREGLKEETTCASADKWKTKEICPWQGAHVPRAQRSDRAWK